LKIGKLEKVAIREVFGITSVRGGGGIEVLQLLGWKRGETQNEDGERRRDIQYDKICEHF
jgi:hypothetical protein